MEQRTIVFVYRGAEAVPAGRLRTVADGRHSYAAFAYGAQYVKRSDAVPVDPEMLPLSIGSTETLTDEGFELFNGIRDSAPDGWGRYLMQKAAGGRTLSEFDYLAASGPHRIGALAFGPTPREPKRIAPWSNALEGESFDLDQLLEAAEQVESADRLDPRFQRLLEAGSSLGGARPKAATMLGGSEWIAKFPASGDSYDIPLAEFATMHLARRSGLQVPPVEFRRVLGKSVYLIERFDRIPGEDGKFSRTPFVSALTMLRAHEIASGDYSYADVAANLRRHGSRPGPDLAELYRRMVFNVLCGNSDDHLRNHGFIHDGREWRLSPLYDVVPKPQIGSERSLVLGLGAAGKAATLANALSTHFDFGLTREAAMAEIERMRTCVAAHWESEFVACGVSRPDLERIAPCFAQSRAADWQSRDEATGWLP